MGARSSLHFVIVVGEALQEQVWPDEEFKGFKVTVASLKTEDLPVCDDLLGCKSHKFCSLLFDWSRRPRFYWFKKLRTFGDSETWAVEEKHWWRVCTSFSRPPVHRWLDHGSSWPGETEGRPHPTFLRYIVQ